MSFAWPTAFRQVAGVAVLPGPSSAGTALQVLRKNAANDGTEFYTLDLSGYAPLASPTFTGVVTVASGTSQDGAVLVNSTAATSGNQQYSPRLRLTGQGWKTTATAASQQVDWIIENQPVQGTVSPASDLVFSQQTNGGGYTYGIKFRAQTITGNGGLTLLASANGVSIENFLAVRAGNDIRFGSTVEKAAITDNAFSGHSTFTFDWSSTAQFYGGSDTRIKRRSASVVELHDCNTTGNTGLFFSAKSTTTNSRERFALETSAVDNTDASRKYRAVLSVYDTAAREAIRIEADGAAARIGFLGATAVVRQTITGTRGNGDGLASLLTGMASLGLIVDSTTAGQTIDSDFFYQYPIDGTVVLKAKASFAFTIDQIRGLKTASGTLTLAVQVNGVSVTGLSALAVTSTPQDVTASAANAVAVGDRITLVISATSGANDLEYTLKGTR